MGRLPTRLQRAMPSVSILFAFLLHASPSFSAPTAAGFRDFSFGTAPSAPTGEKPESKLWWNDGAWWGVLWNTSASGYTIHRLDPGTQDWSNTGVLVDTRASAKVDVLWDGSKLYVASHVFASTGGPASASSSGRVYRYSYDGSNYSLDSGFPVTVNSSKSETLVLDEDSTGKLWVTWTEAGRVRVNRSTTSDRDWGTPFDLSVSGASNLTSDDIASVVHFGAGQTGIMWSNQNDQKMYFSAHVDGADDMSWGASENASAPIGSGAVADDHINLKPACTSDGMVYAATKTSLTSGSSTLVAVLVRSPSGSWSSHTFGTVSDNHTRPILLIDEDASRAYVFAMSDKSGRDIIYMKSASLSSLSFPTGLGTPFVDSPSDVATNNPSSTKQCVNSTTGIVVEASDDGTNEYLHNVLDLGGSGGGGGNVTFTPAHDAQVNDGNPGANYGTSTALRVRAPSPTYHTYLKFNVSGLTQAVQKATLRIYCTDDSPDAGSVYLVSNSYVGTSTAWTETGLTWNNAPVIGGSAVAGSRAAGLNGWVEWDVTSAINGNGTFSLGLASGSTNSAYFSSKEGANAPQLVIETGGSPPPSNPPTVSSFSPASGPAGTAVTVNGTHFANASAVKFNGTSASFTIDSDTQLHTTVPSGATTGRISVTNPDGTGQSASSFTVTTSPPGGTVTFTPVHDTQTNSGNTSGNYGALSPFRVRAPSPEYDIYLQFNVTGLTSSVQKATLRLYCTDESPDGGSVYSVSNNYAGTSTPWTESGLTWSNAPAFGGTPVAGPQPAVLNAWSEWDVTSAITGNGTFSLGMKTGSTNSAYYSSKEGANPPQLVINTGAPQQRSARELPVAVERLAVRPFPSPSSGRTVFTFATPRAGRLELSLYDLGGRRVRDLSLEVVRGEGRLEWDGLDGRGDSLPAGLYLYRYALGADHGSGKLILER